MTLRRSTRSPMSGAFAQNAPKRMTPETVMSPKTN
jgi:hypothetical protein